MNPRRMAVTALLILSVVQVGTSEENGRPAPYDPTPGNRLEGRPADLWRFYMHGIVDDFATPFDITSLVGALAEDDALRVEHAEIRTPYGDWSGPGLRYEGAFQRTLDQALPLPIEQVRGKKIRLFFWERGVDTGRENSTNSYSDAPNLLLLFRNAQGRTITTEDTFVKTTGTFPWHCYHDEVFVPNETAAIYLRFSNLRGGTVWYAAFSWEPVTEDNAFTKADRQDPLTGSLTCNPDYDALNWHLNRGMATRYTWNFFRGPSAGLKGQPYDVTTREGLRRYFYEKAKTDNDHLNHGLMYFASRYHCGKAAGVLPEGMDEAWLTDLSALVVADQDPETGYWGTNHTPRSMGITFHLTEGLFNYYSVPRTDRDDVYNDFRHMGIKEIPRAGRIIETTLKMQSTVTGPEGQDLLAGWPRHAYNFTGTPNAEAERCSLVVTSNAIWMMRRCERFVDDRLRRRTHESVRAAVRYTLEHCVLEDGSWVQSDTETSPTKPSYMEHILETSRYLERKLDPNMQAPEARVATGQNGELFLQWIKPSEETVALRIYAAPAGTPPESLDESDLAGIIHRTGSRVHEMDPLIAARTMGQARARRWGSGWTSRKGYLGWKLKDLTPDPLPYTNDGQPLQLTRTIIDRNDLFVSAVTWYGEESPPIRLPATR